MKFLYSLIAAAVAQTTVMPPTTVISHPTIQPFRLTCRDVVSRVTKTNSWTCRDCFNIRVNFQLGSFKAWLKIFGKKIIFV